MLDKKHLWLYANYSYKFPFLHVHSPIDRRQWRGQGKMRTCELAEWYFADQTCKPDAHFTHHNGWRERTEKMDGQEKKRVKREGRKRVTTYWDFYNSHECLGCSS